MSALENPVYRFRGFKLEPAERRLSEAGKPIALTPKVFDTLVLLVERAGHVVSKDELMKVLWPRGYVDDSNLTKHIWLIRRALGDGEQDSRFIETVPKLGYRFVVPVTTGGAPLPGPSPTGACQTTPALASTPPALAAAPAPGARPAAAAPEPATHTRASRRWFWGAALGAGLLGLLIAWRLTIRPTTNPVTGRHGHAVAFVRFSNLSGNAKDAWLSLALTEMLGAELGVADNLQVVPDELVRDASADLPAPAAGGYAPQTLARLRQRLDADYIVSGSYLVTGTAADAPLRVDIALQDARNGAVLASLSNQSGVSELIALVTKAGGTLRDKLGATAAGAQTLELVANAQPPTVDVARRMGFALDALQHYDAARARDELIEAVAG